MGIQNKISTLLFTPKKGFLSISYKLGNRYLRFLLNRQKIEGDFVFVTGADSSHSKSVMQFLDSFLQFENKSKIIFYDLGLTDQESAEIKSRLPGVIYRKFDYSQFPDFFDIKINMGQYAWKPAIIWQVLTDYQCKVIWMDAGTLIVNKLDNLKKYICLKGYFWNYSPGTILDWTHEKTLSCLNTPKSIWNYRNLASGAVGIDYENEKAMEIAFEWKECAMHKECIAPDGSDRTNHRQDQAVLTVLVHKKGLGKGLKLRKAGFWVQQDID